MLLLHSSINTRDKEIIFRVGKQWKKTQEQHKYLRTGIASRDHRNLGESACSTIARTPSLDGMNIWLNKAFYFIIISDDRVHCNFYSVF